MMKPKTAKPASKMAFGKPAKDASSKKTMFKQSFKKGGMVKGKRGC